MLQTFNLDMQDTVNAEMIDDFLVSAAWAICSTHHTVLKSLPGADVFGRDMLFDIPYIAVWSEIWKRRQIRLINRIRKKMFKNGFNYKRTEGPT